MASSGAVCQARRWNRDLGGDDQNIDYLLCSNLEQKEKGRLGPEPCHDGPPYGCQPQYTGHCCLQVKVTVTLALTFTFTASHL